MKRMLIALAVVLVFPALAPALVGGIPEPSSDDPEIKAILDQANALFADRDNESKARQALSLYEKALEKMPENETLLVRLSHACYWLGNDVSDSRKEEKKAIFEKGVNYANKAIQSHPSSIPANFWSAVCKASHGNVKGIMQSVSYLPDIKAKMKMVEAKEPFFFYGGPQRLWSRIIAKSPGFLRKAQGTSLEEAEKMLKEAIAKYPDFLMTHRFLAELYLEMDRRDEAKKILEETLAAPIGSNKDYLAENRREKIEIKSILAREFGS